MKRMLLSATVVALVTGLLVGCSSDDGGSTGVEQTERQVSQGQVPDGDAATDAPPLVDPGQGTGTGSLPPGQPQKGPTPHVRS